MYISTDHKSTQQCLLNGIHVHVSHNPLTTWLAKKNMTQKCEHYMTSILKLHVFHLDVMYE